MTHYTTTPRPDDQPEAIHPQQAFLDAIAANTPDGYHLVPGDSGEPFFSWRPCECCGSTLGGDRHSLAYIQPGTNAESIMLDACTDCLLYVANGDLPEAWEQ